MSNYYDNLYQKVSLKLTMYPLYGQIEEQHWLFDVSYTPYYCIILTNDEGQLKPSDQTYTLVKSPTFSLQCLYVFLSLVVCFCLRLSPKEMLLIVTSSSSMLVKAMESSTTLDQTKRQLNLGTVEHRCSRFYSYILFMSVLRIN